MSPVPELNDLVDTVGDRCPAGTELDRLRAASEVAREVGRLGEDLVTHFVDEARASGASWSDIGDVLGVTRQGAHQRHHDRPRPERWWRPGVGRFTPRARSAIRAAIDEAREADHTFVGTEHILLGILDVPGNLGIAAVERGGVTADALRHEVTARLLPAHADPPPGTRRRGQRRPDRRRLPFTPYARRVFDLAIGEALAFGHNYIGCEHLLLAVGLSDGIAAEALRAQGLDVERLRQVVIELLADIEPPPTTEAVDDLDDDDLDGDLDEDDDTED
ncbi:MAG: ATP-dependent Clp protease ATP-binding subunit [Acidimicrobiia bacterium]|nr:ATP-dependent Clp protease ATP-binding subunit [Acidimicrobiia bacterium]